MNSNVKKTFAAESSAQISSMFERKILNRDGASSAVVNDSSSAAAAIQNTQQQKHSRVIKQIFTLDAKKLKSLGIESNILSAITKFNGRKSMAAAPSASGTAKRTATLPMAVQCTSPTGSRTSELAKSPASGSLTTIMATSASTKCNQKEEMKCVQPTNIADKKVHVLSDVVLNEVNLGCLSVAVASKSIKNVLIGTLKPTKPITEASTPPVKEPEQCVESAENLNQSFEVTFYGFDLSEEEIARIQWIDFNAIKRPTPTIEPETEGRNDDSISESEKTQEVVDDASDAVSDLSMGELIYTARLAIENGDDCADDSQSELTADDTTHEDSHNEHNCSSSDDNIDKNKMIDDFLSSMKTSFFANDPVDDDDEEETERAAAATTSGDDTEDELYTKLISKPIHTNEYSRRSSATIENIGSDVELTIIPDAANEIEIEFAVPSIDPSIDIPSPQIVTSTESEPIIDTEITDTPIVTEEEIVPSTPPIPVPSKRRGRKPKHEQMVTESAPIEFEITFETPIDAAPEPDPEKPVSTSQRGRRRTQRIIGDYFQTSNVKQIPVEAPPSKTVKKEVENAAIVENQIVPPTSTPGRRGRKRKLEEETVAIDPVPLVETPSISITPRARGRKRKRSISEVTSTDTQTEANCLIKTESQDQIDEIPPAPKRGRKKREDDQANSSVVVDETPPQPKRGRGKKTKNSIPAPVNAAKSFTCGNCKEDVPVQRWKKHENSHYGLGWRDGLDSAIDLNDDSIIARLMQQFMKRRKIQYFTCAKCGEKKRSTVGFISHMQVCGLSPEELEGARVACEHCGKTYRKASLPSHIQGFCPVLRIKQQQKEAARRAAIEAERAQEENENEQTEEQPGDSSRPRRRAAAKSRRKKKKRNFQETTPKITAADFVRKLRVTGGTFIGWNAALRDDNIIRCSTAECTFTTMTPEAMHKHYKACMSSLKCALCTYAVNEIEKLLEHISADHAETIEEMNAKNTVTRGSDEENENDEDEDFHASGDEHSSSDYSSSGVESSDWSSEDEWDSECDDRRLRVKHKKSKRVRSVPYLMETTAASMWRMVRAHYQDILQFGDKNYPHTMQWTRQFIADNYDRDTFPIKDVGGTVRLVSDPRKYLKMFNSNSILFRNSTSIAYAVDDTLQPNAVEDAHPSNAVEVDENEWKQLPLFGSHSQDVGSKSPILFCGGPIVAMEWIPFPVEYEGPQMLVICTRNPNGQYTILRGETRKCEYMIQVWRITMRTKTEIEQCEFVYGIGCDDGSILSMKMCPSSAYVKDKQLGLLAVPCQNGNVNILSLPCDAPNGKQPKIIATRPKIVLHLGETQATVSQLTWSRTKDHTIICAGYTNGMIAIWDLCNLKSTYLCHRNADGSQVLQPQRIFQPTQKCVTIIELHGDHENVPRWLLVGSFDRKIAIYDLNDPFPNKLSTETFTSRLISGNWPIHWPHYICLYDSAMGSGGASSSVKPVHEIYNLAQSRNLSFNGTPSNMAFNDWLNCCIYGNDNGDLFFIRFQQLLLHDRLDSSSDLKIIGTTNVVECDAHQRIVFNDIKPIADAEKCRPMRRPPVDDMAPTKVNRVACNGNESHHKCYAVGYEAGFCRINWLP